MTVRRNTIYNLVGAAAPLAVSLITIPLFLESIGEERFGIFSIAWLLLGYFGLFDLGLTAATAQRIAAQKNSEASEREETFWTALALNAGFGLLGGLIIWPVAYLFFSGVFEVSDQIRQETLLAIPWLVAAVPLATIKGVFTGALQGRECFLSLNVINIINSISFQLLPLSIAWFYKPELPWLLLGAVSAQLITFALLFARCWISLPLIGIPKISREVAAPLFKFGGWVTVTGIAGQLMVILDRFVIGAINGAQAVTHYTVPYNLVRRATLLSTSLASALFPRFVAAGPEEQKRLFMGALKVLLLATTPAIMAGLLFLKLFLAWWISPQFAENSGTVGQVLLLGVWMNSLAYLPYVQLQATGRPDIVAKCHLAELIPYLLFLYIALTYWGIVGAAIVWSVRTTFDCFLLFSFSNLLGSDRKVLVIPCILLGVAALGMFTLNSEYLVFSSLMLLLTICWTAYNAPEFSRALALTHS